MSKMSDYLLELEDDFENLSVTSMEWTAEIWAEQAADGRFNITAQDWKYSHIYWFENYVSVIAAKKILREIGEDYKVLADDSTGEWVILSTYTSLVWKGL